MILSHDANLGRMEFSERTEVNKLLIKIAPAPTFWRIVAFNDRMTGCVEMFGCMLVRRKNRNSRHDRRYDIAANEPRVSQSLDIPHALGVTSRICDTWVQSVVIKLSNLCSGVSAAID
jgi:hypothetical protein